MCDDSASTSNWPALPVISWRSSEGREGARRHEGDKSQGHPDPGDYVTAAQVVTCRFIIA